MAKTIYFTASSLDGYIADSNHSLDWLFQFGEAGPPSYEAFIRDIGAIAMGAKTYEWIARYLVASNESDWPYHVPTWVFTHRDLPPIAGAEVRFVQGAAASVHAAMCEAAGERNCWIAGGGDLVGQFYDAGLLNEIIVQVAPLTLGGGAPLLPRRIHPPLELTRVDDYGGGFVELRYTVSPPEGVRSDSARSV